LRSPYTYEAIKPVW